MHAAVAITLCWAALAASLVGPVFTQPAMLIVLAMLLAFVGLPHGAADHRFARSRLLPLLGRSWLAVFLLGYLATAAVVVIGWMFAPAATILLFFLASAWHFGQEEPHLRVLPRVLRPLAGFARGGLVIWTPLIFRHAEVLQILRSVAPTHSEAAVTAVAGPLWMISAAMLAVAVFAWTAEVVAAVRSSGQRRQVLLCDSLLVLSFLSLFTLANTLVSFAVYFCGWHSFRGLSRLRRELGESWRQLAASLAPLTGAAVALILVVGGVLLPAAAWDKTLIRATFVGLSAVAVPHLLLHGIDVSLLTQAWSRRVGMSHAGSWQ